MPGFRILEILMNERGEVELDGPEERPESIGSTRWKLEKKILEPVNLFTDIFNEMKPKPSGGFTSGPVGGFTRRREGLFNRLLRRLSSG